MNATPENMAVLEVAKGDRKLKSKRTWAKILGYLSAACAAYASVPVAPYAAVAAPVAGVLALGSGALSGQSKAAEPDKLKDVASQAVCAYQAYKDAEAEKEAKKAAKKTKRVAK